MRQLDYLRPGGVDEAVAAVAGRPDASFLGGGSNLIDHLKLGVAQPGLLVDVTALGLDQVTELDPAEDGTPGALSVGANVRNADLAAHPRLRRDFPGVVRALLAGASGQIRNQATTAGNLLQRTRCVYFQDVTTPCNKREPGSGCSAVEGYGRYNAVLGASEQCVAVHPSDLAVGLAAADAVVVVQGPVGERRIPLVDLHRLPGDDAARDTVLEHGELITAVELTPTPLTRNATYYKARDRASYAFALVSVAAGLDLVDGVVADVAIAWGGVAHRPWRATRAEELLRGERLTEDAVRAACEAELADARTSPDNAFKPAMVRNITALTLVGLAHNDPVQEGPT